MTKLDLRRKPDRQFAELERFSPSNESIARLPEKLRDYVRALEGKAGNIMTSAMRVMAEQSNELKAKSEHIVELRQRLKEREDSIERIRRAAGEQDARDVVGFIVRARAELTKLSKRNNQFNRLLAKMGVGELPDNVPKQSSEVLLLTKPVQHAANELAEAAVAWAEDTGSNCHFCGGSDDADGNFVHDEKWGISEETPCPVLAYIRAKEAKAPKAKQPRGPKRSILDVSLDLDRLGSVLDQIAGGS